MQSEPKAVVAAVVPVAAVESAAAEAAGAVAAAARAVAAAAVVAARGFRGILGPRHHGQRRRGLRRSSA
jgi:hypothetical protein